MSTRLKKLIARAPWREASPTECLAHEYVLSERDGQRELLSAVYARFRDDEGVDLWYEELG